MLGGFALIAWPASYRNSGVMSFIVNHDGMVYEKDLVPDTTAAAGRITRFNPDSSRKKLYLHRLSGEGQVVTALRALRDCCPYG